MYEEQFSDYGTAHARGVMPTPTNGALGGGVSRAPMAMEHLSATLKSAEELHSIISNLENRLGAVVRPTPPQTDAPGTPRPTPSVPLSQGLVELNARIQGASQRLDSLLTRVEL